MKQHQNLWHSIFSFNGRISRKEFIFYALILQTLFMIVGIGLVLLSRKFYFDWGIYLGLIAMALSLPMQLAAIARRARDRNHNPWFVLILIMVVPVFWVFVFIYFSTAPSKEPNETSTILSKILSILFFILAIVMSLFLFLFQKDIKNKEHQTDKDTYTMQTKLTPVHALKIDGYNTCSTGKKYYTKDFKPKFVTNTIRNKSYTLYMETGDETLPEYVDIYVENDSTKCSLKHFETRQYKIIDGYIVLLELTSEILKTYASSPYIVSSMNVIDTSMKNKNLKMRYSTLLNKTCCSTMLKYKHKIKSDMVSIEDSHGTIHKILLNFK